MFVFPFIFVCWPSALPRSIWNFGINFGLAQVYFLAGLQAMGDELQKSSERLAKASKHNLSLELAEQLKNLASRVLVAQKVMRGMVDQISSMDAEMAEAGWGSGSF